MVNNPGADNPSLIRYFNPNNSWDSKRSYRKERARIIETMIPNVEHCMQVLESIHNSREWKGSYIEPYAARWRDELGVIKDGFACFLRSVHNSLSNFTYDEVNNAVKRGDLAENKANDFWETKMRDDIAHNCCREGDVFKEHMANFFTLMQSLEVALGQESDTFTNTKECGALCSCLIALTAQTTALYSPKEKTVKTPKYYVEMPPYTTTMRGGFNPDR